MRPVRRRRQSAMVVTLAGLVTGLASTGTSSAAVPGGRDILHVPMAWCTVNGSPAQAAPNVTSEGSTVADTDTDAVIWRRHERPTDNVFLPQASISLRSAINNAWGTFDFPLIADPSATPGNPGDILAGTDEAAVITACDQAYTNVGRAGIGITAVNVNLFRAADGSFQGQGGLGGCSYPIGSSVCTGDFFIVVADNRWYYPTVPNRMIAGWGTPAADPLDLIVAHETGHALTLPHRNDTAALMNPSLRDNNGDGRLDNTALNTAEVTLMRQTAANVPGLETDPPGEFVPGRMLAMRVPDDRNRGLARYLDIAALTAKLDQRSDRLRLALRLSGLLPCRSLKPTRFAYLADLDNDADTGAARATLARLGAGSRFRGADLIARVTARAGKRNCQTSVRAWTVAGRRLTRLPQRDIDSRIEVLRGYRVFVPTEDQKVRLPSPLSQDLLNTIDVSVRNRALPTPIKPQAPFRVATFVGSARKPRDRFGKRDRGARFVLERPRFPHCFPATAGVPGGTVDIRFDGMLPNREIHALLGPNEVLRGYKTDARGGGLIQFPIPKETAPGDHLVTIGHDRLALTADCTIQVREG